MLFHIFGFTEAREKENEHHTIGSERQSSYPVSRKFIKLLVIIGASGSRDENLPSFPQTNSVLNEGTSVPWCQNKREGARNHGSK